MKPAALTIAGSDPSGGAGLQADLKTFHQFGVYGMSAVTLLTVQNTREVSEVRALDPDLVERQIEAVVSDIPPAAAKTGALGSSGIIEAVARKAGSFRFPLVVDPVMISKHGHLLLDSGAVETLIARLLPRAFLVTPNRGEARALSGIAVEDAETAAEAARAIASLGAAAVVVKGIREGDRSVDILFHEGRVRRYEGAWVDTRSTHGTGCTFSAAITACLALGLPLEEAVARAKAYLGRALAGAPGLGGGLGPVDHHAGAGGS